MSKQDTAIRNLCRNLGKDYCIRVIDMEKIIYRDFGNGFNVEVSGVHTSSMKKKANIYLWFGDKILLCTIVRSVYGVPRDKISDTVEELLEYSNALLNDGYDSLEKLYNLKYDKEYETH